MAASGPGAGRPAVAVHGVSKVFAGGQGRGGEEFLALRDLSFSVREGEFASVLGPSGCGKSTLLKIIAGLLPASSGTVELAIAPSAEVPPFGFVFQDSVLLPWRTALDNALFPFEIMSGLTAERRARVRELFRIAGLEGFEKAYPRQLSGGMRQRVSIVRALSYDPPVLLMDEPFGAIDAITRDALNNVLLEIWTRTRKTVLFVTHSIAEAVYLSDRVIVMGTRPGRIVREVDIRLERPRSDDTRLERAFYEHVRELRELLKEPAGTR